MQSAMNQGAACPNCKTVNRVSSPSIANVVSCHRCSLRFIYRPPIKVHPPRKLVGVYKRINGKISRNLPTLEVQS